jgi:hypothetical protein
MLKTGGDLRVLSERQKTGKMSRAVSERNKMRGKYTGIYVPK